MRIAFLSTFYPFRGGISQFNGLIYREFEKEHVVKAFSFKRQYPEFLFPGKTQYVGEEDSVDAIPSIRILDTINPFSYIKTAKAIKKWKPDLFVSRYWMSFFAPSHGFVAARMKGIPRIAILDNVIPHEKRFFDGVLNRYFLKRFDGFVVMSDTVLKDLQSIRPDAPYIKLNHPVYDQFGERLPQEEMKKHFGIPTEKKVLLFFGIIRDYKGLNLLFDALSELDETYHLLVAGEAYGSFAKYEQQIERLGIRDRLSLFNQYIPENEVNMYFSAADVCVLPYLSATQSGITSIAQHFELPIIATDVGGLKESIHHQNTGLIVPKPEVAGLVSAIQYYFDSSCKASYSAQIKQYVLDNSWENFSKRMLKFAEELKLN